LRPGGGPPPLRKARGPEVLVDLRVADANVPSYTVVQLPVDDLRPRGRACELVLLLLFLAFRFRQLCDPCVDLFVAHVDVKTCRGFVELRAVDEEDEHVVASRPAVRVAELRRVSLTLLFLAQVLESRFELTLRDDAVRDERHRLVIAVPRAAARRDRSQ